MVTGNEKDNLTQALTIVKVFVEDSAQGDGGAWGLKVESPRFATTKDTKG